MKIIRKILLAVALTAVLPGCAKESAREYPEAPPYRMQPKGEFPVISSYSFYPEAVNDRMMSWVKEAGFTSIQKSMTREATDSLVALAEKYDMPVMVSVFGQRDTTGIKGVAERYRDNPLVWGLVMHDEPNASEFPALAALQKKAVEVAPGLNTFYNLLPVMGPKQLGCKDYRTYVSDFVATVNPPFISYDIYPVKQRPDGSIYVDPVYYETMGTVRDVALESKRPFWSYILSNKHWMYPKPRTEYLRFQIFSALGYGAQGIIYYTYTMPDFDKGVGEYSYAPIDWNNKRTDTWYMAREVNNEVKNLTPVFLGAEVIDVANTGSMLPAGTKRLETLPGPFGIIDSEGEGLQVSHLRNGDREYLLVVNRDVTKKQKVYLSHSGPVKRLFGNGKEKTEKKNYFTLDPGGYALFSW